MKMNLGCGPIIAEGWVNVDKDDAYFEVGARVYDVAEPGMPDDWFGAFDVIFMNHSLQQIEHDDLPQAVANIKTLLAPGGVLRVSVPNVVAAFDAWQRADMNWFPNKDNAKHCDEALSDYLTWYSTARVLYTPAKLGGVLAHVGRQVIVPASEAQTWELADRFRESLFAQAVKL